MKTLLKRKDIGLVIIRLIQKKNICVTLQNLQQIAFGKITIIIVFVVFKILIKNCALTIGEEYKRQC